MGKPEQCRLNPIEQEQLAAQALSIMDAHFMRPDGAEKRWILKLAAEQITAQEIALNREAVDEQGQ